MNNIDKRAEKLGIRQPKIVLPVPGTDMEKWAVIACDQFTSEPEYWEKVATLTGGNASSLKLIFPEAYLGSPDEEKIIKTINTTMKTYLEAGVLTEYEEGCIYLDRKTESVPSRKGLAIALDLEQYDYTPGSKSLIRASEETIVERLPPRIKIRENAVLELPHILVLIDDPGRTVIEPLAEKTGGMKKVYDTDLMLGGGHIKGYRIDSKEIFLRILSGLEALADPERFEKRYGSKDVFLYAVGDGNHSLATAKAVWEKTKEGLGKGPELSEHPARWALVELMNIYDEGLRVEPIHRTVFNINASDLLSNFDSAGCCRSAVSDGEELQRRLQNAGEETVLGYRSGDEWGILTKDEKVLAASFLQSFLDGYLKTQQGASIDYIHGWKSAENLAADDKNISFFLPPIDKSLLFPTIINKGVLPRKAFSLGEASEKRYYIEARKIL